MYGRSWCRIAAPTFILMLVGGCLHAASRIPAPRDVPYPGVITLAVDATDLDRHIFRVHETIPVRGGKPVVLMLPKWLPGNHSPSGSLRALAGLTIHAGGRPVAWVRDPVEVFAFHVTPPAGATTLELDFQFVSPVRENEGRIVMTPQMLNLQWEAMSLYPAGHFTRRIQVAASVTLPEGWKLATALDVAASHAATTSFETTSYETLVDSPLFAGRFYKRVDLDPGATRAVTLNVFADREDELEIKPEQVAAYRALVQQAYKLFGPPHFDRYDFLLAVTDRMSWIGLEHRRSSENACAPGCFTDWDQDAPNRDLLPHELAHSWNGKLRRPSGMSTPDFTTPLQTSLLWVYEGLTQYWGHVLAVRSGLWTAAQARDSIAMTAANADHTPGREWRSLQDTTSDPLIDQGRPVPWRSFQRIGDFYSEGELIWLDIDTLIRELSAGKRSLDDFAMAFFKADAPYTFEDIVKAMNALQPYDWTGFFRARLDGHQSNALLDGITRGGYRLAYGETQSDYQKRASALRHSEEFTFSLGLAIGQDGTLTSVSWNGPAFKAGLVVGAKLVAVNGLAYDGDRLRAAITIAKNAGTPIELLTRSGDRFRTVVIDYRGGLRYPALEKLGEPVASLDEILTSRP